MKREDLERIRDCSHDGVRTVATYALKLLGERDTMAAALDEMALTRPNAEHCHELARRALDGTLGIPARTAEDAADAAVARAERAEAERDAAVEQALGVSGSLAALRTAAARLCRELRLNQHRVPAGVSAEHRRLSALVGDAPAVAAKPVSARQHARARGALDGADAQALEHALTITERERDAAVSRADESAHWEQLYREAEGDRDGAAKEIERQVTRSCRCCLARKALDETKETT